MNTLTKLADALSVDGVSSSLDAEIEEVVGTLCAFLGAEPRTARSLPGRGYPHAVALVDSLTERQLCLVMYGGTHDRPHVYAMGTESYDAPRTYAALVDRFPGRFTPSRLDVALDFEDQDWFDVITHQLLDIAQRRSLEINQQGDWTRGKGRTLYVGSRLSTFLVRVYEYRECHGYGPSCRLELEVKAKAKHRHLVAAMHPAELLGYSPVVQELLRALCVEIPRGKLNQGTRPPTTVERDLAFLARQALPAFVRVAAALGGDALALEAMRKYALETQAIRAVVRGETVCHTSAHE